MRNNRKRALAILLITMNGFLWFSISGSLKSRRPLETVRKALAILPFIHHACVENLVLRVRTIRNGVKTYNRDDDPNGRRCITAGMCFHGGKYLFVIFHIKQVPIGAIPKSESGSVRVPAWGTAHRSKVKR